MKSIVTTLLAAACAATIASSARAQQSDGSVTAKSITDACAATDDIDMAGCDMFMVGYLNALMAVGAGTNGGLRVGDTSVCLPNNISAAEVGAIFLRGVRTYPKFAGQPAAVVLWFALANQFPCR